MDTFHAALGYMAQYKDTFHAALVYVGYGTALVIFVIALFSAASGLTSKMARVRAIGLALLFALGASILDRLL